MGKFLVEEEPGPDHQVNDTSGNEKRASNPTTRMSGVIRVVEFLIGDELFAVDLFDTREVITTPEMIPIPNSETYVTGMIDLRGVITTIIDLRVLMHITRESTGKKMSRVIILDKTVSEKKIGILVDDVSSVTTYSKEDIDQDARSSSHSERDILGIIRKRRKGSGGDNKSTLVIFLDMKALIGRVEKNL